MREYLIFNTQAQALAAAAAIYQIGAAYAASLGRTVDEGIVSTREDGADDPAAAKSTAWDIPKQRLTDGKWIVLHPQYHPNASDPDAAAMIGPAVIGLTVETWVEDWFEVED